MFPWSQKLRVAIAFLLAIILSLICGLIVLWLLLALGVQGGASYVPILWVSIVPLFYAAVLVHELGHLLVGWAVGLHILQFLIGPIQILRVRGKFGVRLVNPLRHLPGLVTGLYADDRRLRPRLAAFAAAGPLASLLAAIFCMVSVYAFSERVALGPPRRPWSFWQRLMLPRNAPTGWLNMAAIMNLLLLLGTLAPGERRGFLTDGAQLLDLLWGGRLVVSRALNGILTSALWNGVRPRAWDQALVQRLLALRTDSRRDMPANLYGYYYGLDVGHIEQAGELLDLAITQLGGYPMSSRSSVLVEAAFFEGRYRKDARAARQWLEQVHDEELEQHTWLRAEAAVLLAEGHHAEAAARAEAGLEAVPRSLDPGGSLAEADLLRDILAEAKKVRKRGQDP